MRWARFWLFVFILFTFLKLSLAQQIMNNKEKFARFLIMLSNLFMVRIGVVGADDFWYKWGSYEYAGKYAKG